MSAILQKVIAAQDDSSHWYVLPFDAGEEFYRDLTTLEEDETFDFGAKWDKYRTGGDLNNIQLWAEI